MGFVKGTDGIARTVRNPLEGSIGDITLNDVSVTTLSASANISTSGNLVAIGNVDSGNVISTAVVRGVTVQATGNLTGGNANISNGVFATTGGFGGNVSAGNLSTGGRVFATGNITGGNITTAGNVTGNTAGFAIGYRDIPQVSFSGNATIATTDAGKHYYSTLSTGNVLTIANNASQGFQVGAAISIVNQGTGTISIAQGSGVTLYLAGNATSGNRSVATFGMATIIKVATDTWFINGTGVS
jgi:hypothetical protein